MKNLKGLFAEFFEVCDVTAWERKAVIDCLITDRGAGHNWDLSKVYECYDHMVEILNEVYFKGSTYKDPFGCDYKILEEMKVLQEQGMTAREAFKLCYREFRKVGFVYTGY